MTIAWHTLSLTKQWHASSPQGVKLDQADDMSPVTSIIMQPLVHHSTGIGWSPACPRKFHWHCSRTSPCLCMWPLVTAPAVHLPPPCHWHFTSIPSAKPHTDSLSRWHVQGHISRTHTFGCVNLGYRQDQFWEINFRYHQGTICILFF